MNWLRKPMADGRQWITDEEWHGWSFWLDMIGLCMLILVVSDMYLVVFITLLGWADDGIVVLRTLATIGR